MRSVQDLHQPAAADGDGLTGLDVLGAVAEIAVHVGVIGRQHGELGLGLLGGQSLNVELGGLVLALHVGAHGLQALGAASAVAHLDPQGLQLRGLGSVLGDDLHDVLVDTDLHSALLRPLLLEVALQQTLERLAMPGLIPGHLMHGVVDGVQAVLLGACGQVELALGSAVLGYYCYAL